MNPGLRDTIAQQLGIALDQKKDILPPERFSEIDSKLKDAEVPEADVDADKDLNIAMKLIEESGVLSPEEIGALVRRCADDFK